jgi:hypothetical protein
MEENKFNYSVQLQITACGKTLPICAVNFDVERMIRIFFIMRCARLQQAGIMMWEDIDNTIEMYVVSVS